MQYWIAGIFFVISTLAGFGLLWQFMNHKGKTRRGHGATRNRDAKGGEKFRIGDQGRLNRHEKQIVKRAKAHIRNGEIMAGAVLYESIGMSRNAIQLLEENGFIHDACKILLRMNRPNRAGVLFARNGMWDRAIDCFRIAGMPLEVAKCHKELRNYAEAAPLYAEAGRMKEAAFCYRECGQLEKAAAILIEIDEPEAAIKIYELMAARGMNLGKIQMAAKAVQYVLKYCLAGNLSKNLVAILIGKGRYADLLFDLQQNERFDQLSQVMLYGNETGLTQLIADQRFRDEFGVQTARILARCGQMQYAGILFERGFQFLEAGEAFEKCAEFERAAYCFQRGGDPVKAQKIRSRSELKDSGRRSMSGRGQATQSMSGSRGGQDSLRSQGRSVSDRAKINRSMNDTAKINRSARAGDGLLPTPAKDSAALARAATEKTVVSERLPVQLPADEETKRVVIGRAPEKPRVLTEDELNDFYIFSQTNFVSHLPEGVKLDLFRVGKVKEYAEEEHILGAGDSPNGFYTIISGAVKCFKMEEGRLQFVDVLNPSDSFGEVWLLSGYLAPMVFQAAGHVRLFYFPSQDLFRYLEGNGAVLRSIYLNFSSRLISQFVEQPAPAAASISSSVKPQKTG